MIRHKSPDAAALAYMHDDMGHKGAKIVDRIFRDGEALILFDNDLCLHVGVYGWLGEDWEVINETDGDDFRRNKN